MTDSALPHSGSRELIRRVISGWTMLAVIMAVLAGTVILFVTAVSQSGRSAIFLLSGALGLAFVLICLGFFTLQPNESRLLILFGNYHGTVRLSGFFWANPLYARSRGSVALSSHEIAPVPKGARLTTQRSLSSKLSLRARNFNSEKLKVNDKRGNPVEIAAVIVWRVEDTARAAFDVDDFESYVQIQSESALRHLASLYAYDRAEDESEPTLRDSAEEVAAGLRSELSDRLAKAGVTVDEARLTHLAYAPEIAQAMLRRQQAEAVIAARTKIVHGAVSMVEMALRELSEKAVVEMDEERKAAMVSNLLVVLCGESEVTPVVNTGTLYA